MDTRSRRATFCRALCAACALLGGVCCQQRCAQAVVEGGSLCPQCDLLIGAGTTFWPWHWTDGTIASVLLEADDSRWELGAFRFATRQYLKSSLYPPTTLSARPYWGFSLMRRWQVLHRSRWKLYLGFGAAYKTEVDLLDATRWNFAYVLAIRRALGKDSFLEVSLRHWSNAWIKQPNRGQNLLSISIGFQ